MKHPYIDDDYERHDFLLFIKMMMMIEFEQNAKQTR